MKILNITIAVLLVLLAFYTPILAEDIDEARGKITFLRINNVDDEWGTSADRIEVEVVIKLDTKPGFAFGFKLRDDRNRAVRQGMLDILRDAFNYGWYVTINYNSLLPNQKNGEIIRVWVTK